jgi:hypothetical protein
MGSNIDENHSIIMKTDKISLVSSVPQKPVGYNSKNSNFEKLKTEKSSVKLEKPCDKLEKTVGLPIFHSKFEF